MTVLARAAASDSDRARSVALELTGSARSPLAGRLAPSRAVGPLAIEASVGSDPKPESRGEAEVSREAVASRSDFRPTDRVKRRADFRRIQSTGRKIHTPHFVVAVLPRPEGGPTRLGITVTRKVAGAVGRNRVKRVMREVFRRNRELFPSACDVVVIAKEGAHTLGYAEALGEIEASRRSLATAHLPRAPRAPGAQPRGRGRS